MTKEEAIKEFVGYQTYDIQPSVAATQVAIEALRQKPKVGHCKDCKHWKDSDGTYRRGIDAESKCPMNCKEVYEGTGYCFLFESNAESEDNDSDKSADTFEKLLDSGFYERFRKEDNNADCD